MTKYEVPEGRKSGCNNHQVYNELLQRLFRFGGFFAEPYFESPFYIILELAFFLLTY